MDLVTPSRISSKAVWHDLLPNESSDSQYNLVDECRYKGMNEWKRQRAE